MIWTDNMLIPKGGNVYTASVYMNYYYTPKIAAEVEDYVNYICPVTGATRSCSRPTRPSRRTTLIFPTQEMFANVAPVRREGRQQPEVQGGSSRT